MGGQVQVLRSQHFGQLAARLRVREVALMVTDRISRGAFVPTGSRIKALDNIKIKVLGLELPDRQSTLPAALEQLLAWAQEERTPDAARPVATQEAAVSVAEQPDAQ
jgi:hypothetical protein